MEPLLKLALIKLAMISIALTTTDVVDFAKKSFSQGILVNPTTKLVTY